MPLSIANKLTFGAVTAGVLLGALTWSTMRAVRAARELAVPDSLLASPPVATDSVAVREIREGRAETSSTRRDNALTAANQASVAARLTWIDAILLAGVGFVVFRHEILARRDVEVAQRTQLQQDEQLRALSLIDDLTGLNNRRGFLTLAEQQIKFARRHSRELVLLFVDMDDFKQINDKYGHQEGDVALQRAARVLRATFRDSDIIARLGGDEFVVLAADTGTSAMIVERLRRALVERNQSEDYPYNLSFSVGAARFDPEDPPTIQELLHTADEMLYEQKRSRPRSAIVAD
jgi:diguanylate cyclase (GGDEF)-like protein